MKSSISLKNKKFAKEHSPKDSSFWKTNLQITPNCLMSVYMEKARRRILIKLHRDGNVKVIRLVLLLQIAGCCTKKRPEGVPTTACHSNLVY